MRCPSCGNQADASGDFCVLCGSRLEVAFSIERAEGVERRAGYGPAQVCWRGGQVGMAILLVGIAFLLISAVTLLLEPLADGMAWGVWIGSHAIGAVILAVVWLLGRDEERISLEALGLSRPRLSWPYCGLLVLLTLGLSISATALYAWLVKSLGVELLLPPEMPGSVVLPGLGALLTFEALAVWTPLTEELFFRGFVFAGLVSRWGPLRASLGSALIFSAFHLYPGALIPIFCAGLLLAWLYRFTGSLWPAILAHAGQNALALAAIIYEV